MKWLPVLFAAVGRAALGLGLVLAVGGGMSACDKDDTDNKPEAAGDEKGDKPAADAGDKPAADEGDKPEGKELPWDQIPGNDAPKEPMPCGDKTCTPPERCITVVGSLADSPARKECWIQCQGDKERCPEGMECTMIHDGPGPVCQPAQKAE